MDSATEELLYLVAEISIATVALSGITMFLAVSNMKLDIPRSSLINTQLRMAFAVTVFSVIPLFIAQFDLLSSTFWRFTSALYLMGIAYLWIQAGVLSRGEKERLKPAKIAIFAASTAVILLTLNLWLATAWPYMLQLLIAWTSSMILYLGFIQAALDDKVAEDADV